MKELSIKEKAKRYDEALWKAGELYQPSYSALLEEIFPELIKYNNEKVRGAIIHFISHTPTVPKGRINKETMLAWLEKQKVLTTEEDLQGKEDVLWCIKQAKKYAKNENEMGTCWFAEKWLEKQGAQNLIMAKSPQLGEQKSTDNVEPKFKVKYAGSVYNVLEIKEIAGVTYYGIEDEPYHIDYVLPNNCEIVSEQKPADKVEPKFKVGNWYQCTKDFFGKGVTFDKNTAYYCAQEGCLQDEYGCHIAIVKDLYDNFKLWSINDAKDGDVLAEDPIKDYSFPFVAIYKEQNKEEFNSYCFIGFDGNFYEGDVGHCSENIHPATKEQRDTLFAKMKEAGYEWDAEKKELKKISQRMISAEAKEAMYGKPAWSKEDEERLQSCLNILQAKGLMGVTDTVNSKWLKALKDRVQPKQEWSEEDASRLEEVICMIDGSWSALCFEMSGTEWAYVLRNIADEIED